MFANKNTLLKVNYLFFYNKPRTDEPFYLLFDEDKNDMNKIEKELDDLLNNTIGSFKEFFYNADENKKQV